MKPAVPIAHDGNATASHVTSCHIDPAVCIGARAARPALRDVTVVPWTICYASATISPPKPHSHAETSPAKPHIPPRSALGTAHTPLTQRSSTVLHTATQVQRFLGACVDTSASTCVIGLAQAPALCSKTGKTRHLARKSVHSVSEKVLLPARAWSTFSSPCQMGIYGSRRRARKRSVVAQLGQFDGKRTYHRPA